MLTRTSASNFSQPLLNSVKAVLSEAKVRLSQSSFSLFFVTFNITLTLFIVGCSNDTPKHSFAHASQGIYSAALNSNGDGLAIGSINHGASYWQTSDNERLYNWNHQAGAYSEITKIAFSEDQQFVVTAEPQTLVRWNLANGQGDAVWSTFSEIHDIDIFADGRWAIIGLDDHTAVLFDLENGGVKEIFNHNNQVNSVAVSSNREWFATGSNDTTAKLWSLNDSQPIQTFKHQESVQIVELSQDGNRLFTMAQYEGASIWDTGSAQKIWQLPLGKFATQRGSKLNTARFSQDGEYLLTGNTDRKVQLWHIDQRKLIKEWMMPKQDKFSPQGSPVLALAFKKAGGFIAITSDGVSHHLN